MSRIGKQPITIPTGVTLQINPTQVNVSGPMGTLSMAIPAQIELNQNDNQVQVVCHSSSKAARSNFGTIRARLNNMVQGVVTPWKKELEIKGTGYKASLSGNKLTVLAGYIHPVVVTAPEGIQFQVPEDSKIIVTGADKVVVGQVASNIRKIRKPEPYKGKGIRYANEFIKLKAGKTAKA
jgi:large subunit ribosomal protein L6